MTDDDLSAIAGRRDQLEGVLQKRYGYDKQRGDRARQVYNRADVVALFDQDTYVL